MTSPRLAQDSNWGRLYRRPDIAIPSGMSQAEALTEGLLMPSVTNVLDCLDKPFLRTWAARLAAESAYEMAARHPDRVAINPKGAVNYAKLASDRHRDKAANLGDRVHGILEALSLGQDPRIDDECAPFVESWNQFVADWQPEWVGVELTMFGQVETEAGPLRYAGTGDGICLLPDGTRVVLDYKTGKSIHSTAAAQLSALAHAELATPDGETLIPAPNVDAGMVVHVTAKGYKIHPVADLDGLPWEAFQSLRRSWEWHVHEGVRGKESSLLKPVPPGVSLPKRSGFQPG